MHDDDVRLLFERAERDMRPELVSRLADLHAAVIGDSRTARVGAFDDGADLIDLVEVVPATPERETGRRAARWWWLGVAAAPIALLVGVVALSGTGDEAGDGVAGPGDGVDQPCDGAETLLDVATTGGTVTVELATDGATFCLIGDGSAPPVVVGAGLSVVPPDEPTLLATGDGPAGTRTRYELFAMPESSPVTEVRANGRPVEAAVSRVGRRILLVSAADAQPRWELYGGDAFLGVIDAEQATPLPGVTGP
jgi:hypothetical protein